VGASAMSFVEILLPCLSPPPAVRCGCAPRLPAAMLWLCCSLLMPAHAVCKLPHKHTHTHLQGGAVAAGDCLLKCLAVMHQLLLGDHLTQSHRARLHLAHLQQGRGANSMCVCVCGGG
jgi:hypothetical protein